MGTVPTWGRPLSLDGPARATVAIRSHATYMVPVREEGRNMNLTVTDPEFNFGRASASGGLTGRGLRAVTMRGAAMDA
jgi:hypothetical protein